MSRPKRRTRTQSKARRSFVRVENISLCPAHGATQHRCDCVTATETARAAATRASRISRSSVGIGNISLCHRPRTAPLSTGHDAIASDSDSRSKGRSNKGRRNQQQQEQQRPRREHLALPGAEINYDYDSDDDDDDDDNNN